MAYIHETVIWQSPNGSWNIGVYRDFSIVDEDPTVDEALDEFMFVTSNHPSVEAAEASWKGVQNDDDFIIEFDETTKEEISHLEELKQNFFNFVNKRTVPTRQLANA